VSRLATIAGSPRAQMDLASLLFTIVAYPLLVGRVVDVPDATAVG